MTNQNKPTENVTKDELKTQEKLQGKLNEAEFPEMKHQADAALGEEE